MMLIAHVTLSEVALVCGVFAIGLGCGVYWALRVGGRDDKK